MKDSKRDASESGSFKRITITRVETIIRLGTADIWVPDGTTLNPGFCKDDTEQLADLLESRNSIRWDDDAFMKEYFIEAGVEEEDLPEEDQDAAVRCCRDKSTDWIMADEGVR